MKEMVDKAAAILYGGNLKDCYHPELFRRQARRVLEVILEDIAQLADVAFLNDPNTSAALVIRTILKEGPKL